MQLLDHNFDVSLILLYCVLTWLTGPPAKCGSCHRWHWV